ncbi:MAG: ribosome biogenesis GTPase Der [Sedimentisphaerales bacterium]|nr:ribosome biogenesis GTPase Der [Sedimentisphaerales bacterium]
MSLPVVAIVGRPNVGKSSLLNGLARQRISIVEPTAGVTRDRVSAIVDLDDRYFEMVDTGGYGIEDQDNLTEHVEGQIRIAIEQADLVVFVVDIREGVTPLDKQVAKMLRRPELKVLLVANKADSPGLDHTRGEFYKLGFGEPITVSAEHGRNRQLLVERILAELAVSEHQKPEETVMKLAVVGKRNVGKSTFINSLAGEERVIVSEVPGTTRDAVDVRFEKDGRQFIAIDTAGVRKKSKMTQNSIEYYSYTRATLSVQRADVVLFFIDALEPVSQVDKRLARFIADEYKPCIIVINKWDLAVGQVGTEEFEEYLDKTLPGLSYAPISFISASEGKKIKALVDLAQHLYKQSQTKISTSRLNKALEAISAQRAPSARRKVGLPRIYYGTQVAAGPPTLLLFVNNPSAIDENYQRYVVNRLREMLPFSEVPIRLLLRHHREGQEDV